MDMDFDNRLTAEVQQTIYRRISPTCLDLWIICVNPDAAAVNGGTKKDLRGDDAQYDL